MEESFVEILTIRGCAVAPLLSIISVTTPALSLTLYSVGLNPTITTVEQKFTLQNYQHCNQLFSVDILFVGFYTIIIHYDDPSRIPFNLQLGILW